ncbi:Rab-GTPase-TBC domain containing protein [Trypanosoma brucei equiperdum]|uniref:Rab-GTPase-TBC domain containing protein n=1 Tax=Trypanosoma brucei equiperdum TaxID=630700 RepID=A0A3L6LD52_9TRYP|nr:Rab-GTPase-TBC domain containing protein [Trypanosoma brucei equiperdum]
MLTGRQKVVTKGPGTAVRAPLGTLYRVYGFVVVPANGSSAIGTTNPSADVTSTAASHAVERGTVYIVNRNTNETSTCGSSGSTHPSCHDGGTHINEYDESPSRSLYEDAVRAMLDTPLGDVAVRRTDDGRMTVRDLAWSGSIDRTVRSTVWRLLCDCVPPAPASAGRQQTELRRKREEYEYVMAKCCPITITDFLQPRGRASQSDWSQQGGGSLMEMHLSPDDRKNLSQIASDIPRHTQAVFRHTKTVSALARCLFFWSRRYPAVGYVQGIDDIMVVFFSVFLEGAVVEFNACCCCCDGGRVLCEEQLPRNEHGGKHIHTDDRIKIDGDKVGNGGYGGGGGYAGDEHTVKKSVRGSGINTFRACISPSVVYTDDVAKFGEAMERLPVEVLRTAEADAYLCGAFFLSWLQDNFVEGQPGIRRTLALMERVLIVLDPGVLDAITSQGITLMDCCFQWLHCLLARELPLRLVVLLWEKYMAVLNSETVHDFHAYVCAVLLTRVRDNVIGQPVDVILNFLKDPLGTRSLQLQHIPDDESKCSQGWLENLVAEAWKFYKGHPPSMLA